MDRNLREVQQENVRMAQQLAQTQAQFNQLQQQAQEILGQLQQAEQMRIQAASWLLAVLLEHHQGEAMVMIQLIRELVKAPHGVRTDVQPDGVTMKLTAIDANGRLVEKPSMLAVDAGKDGEPVIQAKAPVEESPGEPEIVCSHCDRKNGAHNLDCPERTLV